MRDAITGLIGQYDQLGRYLDRSAIDRIESYFDEAEVRVLAVEIINREASELYVKPVRDSFRLSLIHI